MILRKLNASTYSRLFNSQSSPSLSRVINKLACSTSPENNVPPPTSESAPKAAPPVQKKVVNKAMKAYLERAQEHDEFIKQQRYEYQIGKRHLANMMGEDPETFTQQDIDNAIAYLFPSGLFEKKARPFMKPPEEVFPQRKAAEFDETGRPHHYLFYTGKPNFYKMLYDAVEHIQEINKFEDAMSRKNVKPDPNLALESSGHQWFDIPTLQLKLVETVSERDYKEFIAVMDRLLSLPFSYKAKEFIESHRKPLLAQTTSLEIPKLKYDAEGRAYVTTYECLRKRARGHVTVRSPGTGKITINDEDIRYFHDVQSREQVSILQFPTFVIPNFCNPQFL